MTCSEGTKTQAYADGELDALAAAALESHLEHCAECRLLADDIQEIRNALRASATLRAPASVHARLDLALRQEAPRTAVKKPRTWRTASFWWGATGGAAASALAAGLALFAVLPALDAPLQEQLVAAHVRSLMPAHLIDVQSTDQHTVKPWFAGHADVSPMVADFTARGFRLIGGRADYLEHQRAAAVVYQHGPHIINVFSWAATRPAAATTAMRGGYRLEFFRIGDLAYCAVSDTGWDELSTLVQLIQAASTPPASSTDVRE